MALDISTIGNIAGGAITSYVGNEIGHGQQLRHQQNFMDQQVRGQQQMAKFNQALALETWEKTNYPAQMEQLKKAGLNPGLLYGHGGGGGATTNFGGSQSVSGGQAPGSNNLMAIGLQTAAQIQLLKAQKENLDADTKNKLAQVPVHGATVPKLDSETNKIRAEERTFIPIPKRKNTKYKHRFYKTE